MTRFIERSLPLVVLLTVVNTAWAAPPKKPRFEGDVKAIWLLDGRNMTLLNDFVYVDATGKRWVAKKNLKIDGASIPPKLWSIIGGPFEGKYRLASVVHDAECTKPYKNPWRQVHRMFYEASLTAGTGMTRAKIMYAAVYHFGPRWGPDQGIRSLKIADFLRLRKLILKNPLLDLSVIESRTSDELQRDIPEAPSIDEVLEEREIELREEGFIEEDAPTR